MFPSFSSEYCWSIVWVLNFIFKRERDNVKGKRGKRRIPKGRGKGKGKKKGKGKGDEKGKMSSLFALHIPIPFFVYI